MNTSLTLQAHDVEFLRLLKQMPDFGQVLDPTRDANEYLLARGVSISEQAMEILHRLIKARPTWPAGKAIIAACRDDVIRHVQQSQPQLQDASDEQLVTEYVAVQRNCDERKLLIRKRIAGITDPNRLSAIEARGNRRAIVG